MMKFQLTQKFWFLVFIILNCFVAVTSFILFVLSIKAEDNLFKYKLILQYTIPAIYPTGIFTGSLGLITACLGFIGLWKQMNILYLLFFCCGVNSYADFKKAKVLIPFSCRVGQYVYARGCFDELSEYVQYYITLLTSICFTTSFIYAVFIGVAIRNLRKSIKGINSSS
ncbi:unnamed protein product [Schistosoma curassoni]|nr:unnamed protein product [Schistosoma curassoni]